MIKINFEFDHFQLFVALICNLVHIVETNFNLELHVGERMGATRLEVLIPTLISNLKLKYKLIVSYSSKAMVIGMCGETLVV